MNNGSVLSGVRLLGLDTSPVIYFIEQHPRYIELVRAIMRQIDAGVITGATSTLTLTEVLTVPLRTGDDALSWRYRSLLLTSRNFVTATVSAPIAERAADLRARHGLRTSDAIQAAAALVCGCEAFLTNDAHFRRVTDLRVLILDELVA